MPGSSSEPAETHRRVTDLALDLGTWSQGGNRVDDDGVDGTGAHKHIDDLERLLARIGLGNEDLIDINTDARGIGGIKRVLGIDNDPTTPPMACASARISSESVVLPEELGHG